MLGIKRAKVKYKPSLGIFGFGMVENCISRACALQNSWGFPGMLDYFNDAVEYIYISAKV